MEQIFNLKKNQFNGNDWIRFKEVAEASGATRIKTGKSKFMYYIKVYSIRPIWKEMLNKGTKFNYVPGGVSSNVKWNKINVTLGKGWRVINNG